MKQLLSLKLLILGGLLVISFVIGALYGCTPLSPRQQNDEIIATKSIEKVQPSAPPHPSPLPGVLADILSVQVTGADNDYRFAVEISSPDTGCDQYADWWEVISEEGTLVYRRILAHSHRDEQPFVRSGGPVTISKTAVVIIRAHMHPTGYGGIALKGSVANGFVITDIPVNFAAHTESETPLPDSCAF